MMGWHGAGVGWAMMVTNGLITLLLLAVVVWGVVRLTSMRERRSAGSPRDARAILDRRFASGEINAPTSRAQLGELTADRRWR